MTTKKKRGSSRPSLPTARELPRNDDRFPDGIRKFCPTVHLLRVMGNLELLLRPSLAIVGSRHASQQGLDLAQRVARACAKNGIVIVSGYAKGVDTAAHKGALEGGGGTVFVLPFGVKHFRLKIELRELANESKWLAISQFPDNQQWFASSAMKRNQTLTAISSGVLVVEARETGGTVDEAQVATNMGKPLYVIRYSSPPETAVGNEMLISRHTALPIACWRDVNKLISQVVSAEPKNEIEQQALF